MLLFFAELLYVHRTASREIQKEQLRARLQTGRGRRVGGALLTGSGIPVTPGGPDR